MVVTSTAILASLHPPGFFLPAFHKGYHLKHPTAGHSSTHLASIQEAEASESEFWASLVYIVSSKSQDYKVSKTLYEKHNQQNPTPKQMVTPYTEGHQIPTTQPSFPLSKGPWQLLHVPLSSSELC